MLVQNLMVSRLLLGMVCHSSPKLFFICFIAVIFNNHRIIGVIQCTLVHTFPCDIQGFYVTVFLLYIENQIL